MKTETKHTKGPWRTEGFENLVVNSAEGYTLTLAAGGKDACLDELKANARLIAAAPDLLHALKCLVRETSFLIHGDGTNGAIVANEICNAIATIVKAECNA